jgi:hypothetical protein
VASRELSALLRALGCWATGKGRNSVRRAVKACCTCCSTWVCCMSVCVCVCMFACKTRGAVSPQSSTAYSSLEMHAYSRQPLPCELAMPFSDTLFPAVAHKQHACEVVCMEGMQHVVCVCVFGRAPGSQCRQSMQPNHAHLMCLL